MITVFLTYEFGGLAAADAFFFSFSIATMYVGALLCEHDGRAVGEALRDIFFRPQAQSRVTAYMSQIGVPALASLVVAQTSLATVLS